MPAVDELTPNSQPVDAAAQSIEWLSVSDLARRLNKSKQAISKRLKSLGDLVPTRREGSELLVNVASYKRATHATQDPAQALRNPELDLAVDDDDENTSAAISPIDDAPPASVAAGSSNYQHHRALREGYEAENSRLDLLERIKQTCDRAEVEARTFAIFRQLRDRLLSLPATMASAIMAASDERATRAVFDEAIRDLLEQFARDLDRADIDGTSDVEFAPPQETDTADAAG